MRILHFVSTGARSPFFVDLVGHSDKTSSQFVIGSLSPAGILHRDMATLGVETLALGSVRRSAYASAVARLACFLRRTRVDIIHCHLLDAALVGLAAARLARTRLAILTRHYADANLLAGSRPALLMDRISGRYLAHAVIAVTSAAKRALVEIDKVPEWKIDIVPNGYDWNRVSASPEAVGVLRQKFGRGGETLFCVVGRLDPLKGHDVLLEACARLDRAEAWRLLLVGLGPREKLEAQARSLGIEDRCTFLGFVPSAYDVMAAADVVVHPSRSEAQCQVVIEALALARPVVATDVGGASEVILPGKTGWLVPSGDSAALATAMQEAISNNERARAYGRAGQELVRSLYPIQRTIDGYQAFYRRRLAGR